MAWKKLEESPYRHPTWVKPKTHYIIQYGRFFVLYKYGKKEIQGRHSSLEEAQAAAK